MEKSPDAFRTISEVAEWLDVPTHVLRFWESRFAQVKPVKRAGGRRYYRPTDMQLIGGIKKLLHEDGMTIRGAQKLLREEGVKYVAALSQPLDSQSADVIAFEAKERQAAIAAPVDLIDEATLVPKAPPEPAAAAPDGARAEAQAADRDAAPQDAADTPPAPEMATGAAPAAEPAPQTAPMEASAAEPQSAERAPVSDAPPRIHFGSARTASSDETADPELPFHGSRGAAPELERELDPEIAAEAAAAEADIPRPAAADAPAAPAIPATPDVPEHDPEDTDPAYAATPGMAARLAGVAPDRLAAHKAALSQIYDELSALHQRMG